MVTRQFPRFPVEVFSLCSKDNGPDWHGTAFNLSRGGCAIRSTTPVQKGEHLKMHLFPSTNMSPIEVSLAPVRWATAEQFGVEFVMLSAFDTKRLLAYLAVIGARPTT
jgi:hypothetical protein